MAISSAAGQGDIRSIGSGNIGATNVLRTGRKDIALATWVLDAGKAAVAALIAGHFFPGTYANLIAGGAAMLGHCFPFWLKFKGGKGVATFLGVLLATAWPIGAIACATWLLTAIISRISSLSALIAAVVAPIAALLLGLQGVAIMSALLTVIIFMRHRANISRIASGQEPKIGAKKT